MDSNKQPANQEGSRGRFKITQERRHTILNIELILILGLSCTLLMTLYMDRLPQFLEVGSIAAKDLKADQNYEILDEKSTEKLRQEAQDSVQPVYDYDPTIELEGIKKIREAFLEARTFIRRHAPFTNGRNLLAVNLEEELKRGFLDDMTGAEIDEASYNIIRRRGFSLSVENVLAALVHEVMAYPVLHDKLVIKPQLEKGIILRRLTPEGIPPEEIVRDDKVFQELEKSRKKVAEMTVVSGLHGSSYVVQNREVFDTLKKVARGFVNTNTNYDGLETDSRKQKAQANIKNIIIKIKRGESIIRSGDRFEPWHLTVIEGMRTEQLKTNRYVKFLGIYLFVNIVLLVVYYFSFRYIRKFSPDRKELIFLGLTLILFLVILRVGVFLGSTVRDALPFTVGAVTLYYAIPMAAGAMLVRFIINSETALIFAVIVSLFSGVFIENNLELTVYYLISGVFAAHVIAHVDKRSTVLLCGAYTGIVSALTVLSLNLITLISISGTIETSQIVLNALAGFCGGLFTSMVVLILTPLSEALFNYTTDIKLLEMANLSHPLLKEMIVRAPGTYHHSQIVGILSEAAAQAVGANPLLARVGSYYHDIGKMKKPQYFIENQSGSNPHEKLAPSMSALIISSHVKDGIDMAEEHKLPKRIADMIPQHQGTKLIGYFYTKAKKLEDPELGRIDEKDYRYPGPKPQTREAGIIMLSDTVEAATRSLPEKTPSKIRSTVEKLVNQHFVDEQLDDCELTLRDLHRIAEAFIKNLTAIYHQRIEYPDEALLGGAEVHRLQAKVSEQHGSSYQQRAPEDSNIAPLFRKKDSSSPPSSGTA